MDSQTEMDSQKVTERGVGDDGRESSAMRGDVEVQKGVVAVVVEREDGRSVTFGRHCAGVWPSVDEAKNLVEKVSAPVRWRETTGGVWVARADVPEIPVPDRGRERRRRSDSDTAPQPPAGTATYMAARVLRGIAPGGQSGTIPHGSTVGSSFEGERRAG